MNRSVKRILALTTLFLSAGTAFATAPIGVCINNVAQTISNGVIAPIPYANITLCSAGSTAANCVANKTAIYTSTALSTAVTSPFQADAGGNYFFCSPVGHYALLINSSDGKYFVPDIDLADDWATGGTVTGTWTATSFVGPLTGNASTASALAATPSDCDPTVDFAYGITANGNALCNALPASATLYYQTVQEAGTSLAQQPILNFDGTVEAIPGTGKTNVRLPAVGTSGTYANPTSITTDTQGRVTSVTAGSSIVPRTCNSYGCYKVDADGTIQQWGSATTTTTSCSGNAFSFPTSFTTTSNLSITFGTINSSTSQANLIIVRTSVSTSGFSAASRDGNDNCETNSSFSWSAIGQ